MGVMMTGGEMLRVGEPACTPPIAKVFAVTGPFMA